MIVGVAGLQNSGKTTLIELLVQRLTSAGFSVATVKHIAHDDLRVDAGGSDTERHRRAGARVAAAVSDRETVYFHGGGTSLEAVLARIQALESPDLLIVEGFKGSPLPKIVLGAVEHGGEARWRWDGTAADALRIGEEIMVAVRAERAAARRAKGASSRVPRQHRRRAAPRSGLRARRRTIGRRGGRGR